MSGTALSKDERKTRLSIAEIDFMIDGHLVDTLRAKLPLGAQKKMARNPPYAQYVWLFKTAYRCHLNGKKLYLRSKGDPPADQCGSGEWIGIDDDFLARFGVKRETLRERFNGDKVINVIQPYLHLQETDNRNENPEIKIKKGLIELFDGIYNSIGDELKSRPDLFEINEPRGNGGISKLFRWGKK